MQGSGRGCLSKQGGDRAVRLVKGDLCSSGCVRSVLCVGCVVVFCRVWRFGEVGSEQGEGRAAKPPWVPGW